MIGLPTATCRIRSVFFIECKSQKEKVWDPTSGDWLPHEVTVEHKPVLGFSYVPLAAYALDNNLDQITPPFKWGTSDEPNGTIEMTNSASIGELFPQLHLSASGHHTALNHSNLNEKMSQARIIGCSLTVSKQEEVLRRSGEIYISRTFQEQPETWNSRKVDTTLVRQALFNHHTQNVEGATRMITAPMDFADLNMVPVGVPQTGYARFPDTGC